MPGARRFLDRLPERDGVIARLALPALGALAAEPLYVLADTAIVGRLGSVPLGGLALASTVLNVGFFIFNFLAYGTTARVAFLYGGGDERGAARAAVQGVWVALGTGIVIGAVLLGAGRTLIGALGGSGGVLEAGATYLRISAVGLPFVLLALVGHGYLRGLQDTRTPLVVALSANVLNVVVEIWFVFGLGRGVAGSAWSTVLAQGVAAVCFVALIGARVARTGAGLGPDRGELRTLATAGRHLVVRTGALLAALTTATSVAARMGTPTLAAHQIALQVWTFLALSVDALAIAGQALTGSTLGAGRPDEARATGRRLLRIGFVVGVVFAVVLAAASAGLPRVFTTDPDVISQATVALLLVAVAQPVAAGVFVLDGVLIGASDTRFLQWAMLAALAVFGVCAWALLRWPGLGIAGLWGALGLWLMARLAGNGLRFAGGRWHAPASGDR